MILRSDNENRKSVIPLSVILPSLNVCEYIGEALESVCRQTIEELEIICIDAGSTDGTLEYIEGAAQNDDRIRIIKSPVKSYGYQVNLGIREARGKYVAVLETDDHARAEMYEVLYSEAEKFSADYVKADYYAFITQTNGEYHFFPRRTFPDRDLYGRVVIPLEHASIGRDDWRLWQGIYLRSFLLDNRIELLETAGAAYQDIGFLFWTGIYAKRAVYISDRLYDYRIDREDASSNLAQGLLYSYHEFDQILSALDDRHISNVPVLRMLFARMSRSFVTSCSRIVKKLCENEADIFLWFVEKLSKAIESGLLDEDLLGSGLWRRLSELLRSSGSGLVVDAGRRFLSGLPDKGRVIVFGCGEFGYRVYKELSQVGKSITAFWDNDPALWGTSLDGIPINGMQNAKTFDGDEHIIVANETHYDDIVTQLKENGYRENRIHVYR